MHWLLNHIAGGVVRWIVGVIIAALCMTWGFSPDSWLNDLLSRPPEWVISPYTRLFVVAAGILIIGAMLCIRRRPSEVQPPFAKLQSYFTQMQEQAKAISESGNATNKAVRDWRDRCAKAIRTSLGPDKEKAFCDSEDMKAANLYPSHESAKAALDIYVAALQRISEQSTSYDLVESYDPSDLDRYR